MPKVSVIIPTYNRARYLLRALQSVLDQTFQDLEIVVVDDASTDETPQIVKALPDPRIRYFRHQTNMQEAGSRNTGVQNSVGAYIAFLDDDDVWLSQKLAMQVDLLDRKPSKIGAVYSSFLKIDAESGKVLGQWNAEKRGNVSDALREDNWIGIPSTILVRRECFDRVGLFDEKVEFGLDYDMWIRIAQFYEFDYLEEPLVLRSLNHGRLSTNWTLVMKGKESYLKKYPDFFSRDAKAYSRHLLTLGILYCHNGHLRMGRETLLKAIRRNPAELRNYYYLALSLLGSQNFKRIRQFRDKMASP